MRHSSAILRYSTFIGQKTESAQKTLTLVLRLIATKLCLPRFTSHKEACKGWQTIAYTFTHLVKYSEKTPKANLEWRALRVLNQLSKCGHLHKCAGRCIGIPMLQAFRFGCLLECQTANSHVLNLPVWWLDIVGNRQKVWDRCKYCVVDWPGVFANAERDK